MFPLLQDEVNEPIEVIGVHTSVQWIGKLMHGKKFESSQATEKQDSDQNIGLFDFSPLETCAW